MLLLLQPTTSTNRTNTRLLRALPTTLLLPSVVRTYLILPTKQVPHIKHARRLLSLLFSPNSVATYLFGVEISDTTLFT